MGQRYLLSCPKCGYEKIASLGMGLGSCNPTIIASTLVGEDAATWKKFYDSNSLKQFSFENKLSFCEKCGDIKVASQVKMITNDGEEILLGKCCDECGTELTDLDIDGEIPCSSCKTEKLAKSMRGLWD